MKLIISSVSGEPIYEQIKNQIRSAVMSGELEAGEALPSLRKLAKEQGCDNGFRVIINTGRDGGQEVPHLHIHVLGGPRPWKN